MDGSYLLWIVPIFLVIGFMWAAWTRKKSGENLVALKAEGFNVDHLMKGKPKLAFDEAAKQVAIIGYDGVIKYSYSDLRSWQWHWVDKNGYKTKNEIHFALNDKDRPLLKVWGLSKEDAEQWMAKLDLILA